MKFKKKFEWKDVLGKIKSIKIIGKVNYNNYSKMLRILSLMLLLQGCKNQINYLNDRRQ